MSYSFPKHSRRGEIMNTLFRNPQGLTAAQLAQRSSMNIDERQMRNSLQRMMTDELLIVVKNRGVEPHYFHPEIPISAERIHEIKHSKIHPNDCGKVTSPRFSESDALVAARSREFFSRLMPVRGAWGQSNAVM